MYVHTYIHPYVDIYNWYNIDTKRIEYTARLILEVKKNILHTCIRTVSSKIERTQS